MSVELIIDETIPEEIVSLGSDDGDALFTKELELFLHKQNKNYGVWINKNSAWYRFKNCKIIISADFSCCEWRGTHNGYQECNKCHVKRGCNVSCEFKEFIQKRGYKCEFLDSCYAGLFR